MVTLFYLSPGGEIRFPVRSSVVQPFVRYSSSSSSTATSDMADGGTATCVCNKSGSEKQDGSAVFHNGSYVFLCTVRVYIRPCGTHLLGCVAALAGPMALQPAIGLP